MRALLYIIRCNIKNFIKKALRNPVSVVLYILFFAFIMLSMFFGKKDSRAALDSKYLFIGVNLLVLITLIANINSGLSKKIGLSFGMSDVNFIFTGPFKPQQVLLYGLVRTSGSTLLSLAFLLFQIPNLINFTHISVGQALLVILFYVFVIFVCKVLGLLFFYISFKYENIYLNKNKIILGLIAIILSPLLYLFIKDSSQYLNNLLLYFGGDLWRYVPIVGWFDSVIMVIFEGVNIYFFVSLIAIMALSSAVVYYIYTHEIYFYENAIEGAQKLEIATLAKNKSTKKEAAKAINANRKYTFIKKKVKVDFKRELSWAIFDRHMVEYKKRGFFHVFNLLSLIIVGLAILIGIIMGKNSKLPTTLIYTCGLGVLLLFASLGGKWIQETDNHYIYLIPDHSSKKLFASMLSSLYKLGLDLAIAYVALALVLKVPILEVILAFITAESFVLLNNSGNAFNFVIFRKLDDILRGMLHFFSLMIYLVPSILITILISKANLGLGVYSLYLGILITNILVSFLMLQVGKRVFEVMEN
ncbi:putative ABC exporter domain-containing protein [Clostridium amazonitimonense]|uniref:putative ABC exporter domain-containing protein n=1 Tax=Clostridium amazonitimonense TaxID=1499689 RepID=UPI0005099E93|nr:putative ABC exporter domain-containing protein [Clostridium amazonitimonense]